MSELRKWSDYDRREVHDIFEPETSFTPNSGTWGIHGIIELRGREGDFVFFVTFGQEQSGYSFDEAVSQSGVLTWQSQPRETLDSPRIKTLIGHDDALNTIHLFLRTSERREYTYLGVLRYVTHDAERERPVHFQWQIMDWDDTDVSRAQRIGLVLQPDTVLRQELLPELDTPVTIVERPPRTLQRSVNSRTFRARIVPDRSAIDDRNRSLGRAGEELVVNYERARLRAAGREDLASRVQHVSALEGDGAGFDIASYNEDGSPVFIEVKTTTGVADTPFYLSSHEVAFAQQKSNQFRLYRLYEYVVSPKPRAKAFIVYGDPQQQFTLTPIQYRATS
jgi:Protein NO VEIN, C-terminal/Domain of unknown function (DUF3427)